MLYLRSAARCGREQFPVIAMGKKNLTLRYTLTQFTFWAASTGAASFATTYLLGCGVPSGIIGVLLAAAGLLSCLTQPILAGIADKSKGFIVLKMMIGMSFLCVLCFSVQLIPNVPIIIADNSKAKEFGFQPKYSFEQMLRDEFTYRQNIAQKELEK